MTATRARTPPWLWALGLSIVVGAWFAWREVGRAPAADLTRWRSERLDTAGIRAALEADDADRRAHGLVQMAVLVDDQRRQRAAEAVPESLGRLAAESLESDNEAIRSLAVMALAYLAADWVDDRLLPLLDDADGRVRLNAALALAARGRGEGAPILADAVRATRGDDVASRRELLSALLPVAGPEQRELIERESSRARLDHDAEWAARLESALGRLGAGR